MAKKKASKSPKRSPAAKSSAAVERSAAEEESMTTSDTTADQPAMDYETALDEVKSIVEKLESGTLDLTSSLESYETGIKRLKQCHQLLDAAEQKVSVLSGFDSDGNPVTEPMPETVFRSAAPGDGGGVPEGLSSQKSRKPGPRGWAEPGSAGNKENDVDASEGLF